MNYKQEMLKERYTARELAAMPTLNCGHFDNLKIDTGKERVLLSRMTVADGAKYPNTIFHERLIGGVWRTVKEYPGGPTDD